MKYCFLEWDSRFFGMHVARVTVDDEMNATSLYECLELCEADVIYVFINSKNAEQYRPVLERFSGKCYDRKVTFGKTVDPGLVGCEPTIAKATSDSEALLQLAYASGRLSRFSLDPRFQPHFKPLYAEWVRKSLMGQNSKVFTIFDTQRLVGMVTASIDDGIGRIGLIAIDEGSRGRGLGMRLLMRCESYYNNNSVRICKVVTQRDNIAACKLYQKAGYMIENEQDVWHIWKI